MTIRKSNLNFEKNLPAKDQVEESFQINEVEKAKPDGEEQIKAVKSSEELSLSAEDIGIGLRKPPLIEVEDPVYSLDKLLERISDATMDDLMILARELHPLPRESQMHINKTYRNWFISQLRNLNDESKLVDFAFSLKQKELTLLFPILATNPKKYITDRIEKIISLRLSKVLYIHGWITLQYIYPDARFAKIVASVCRDLENEKFPFEDLLERGQDKQGVRFRDLPYPHFNWPKIRLITEVAAPDNRRFITAITNYLLENELELEDFFHQFGIYSDLALGQAIKNNYEIEKIEKILSFEADSRPSWRDLFSISKNEIDIDDEDDLY